MNAERNVKPLLVRMPLKLHTSLVKEAAAADVSMAQFVRRAIRREIARSKRGRA